MALIHSSYFRPKILSEAGSLADLNIDRCQSLTASVSLNREKIKEIGRDGTVGYKTGIPDVTVGVTQLEYGTLDFWKRVTSTNSTALTLSDFKTSYFGIAGYKTDDDGTFLGTVWYPGLRVNGFSFNIGDPEANCERVFDLVGNDEIMWLNDNKYLIHIQDTFESGDTAFTITSGDYADYPLPIEDPDVSGQFLVKVVRVRSNIASDLVLTTDYAYNGVSGLFTPVGAEVGDTYNLFYSAGEYISTSGATPFTANDTDAVSIPAENVSIYLTASDYVYRLQSVAVDVSFDRQDVLEIGNTDVVARGVRESTVSITLGKILETFAVEEILRGEGGNSYGKIDARQFATNNKLIIKIYDSSVKDTFLMGYSFDTMTPNTLDAGTPTSDYVTRGVTLEGEDCTITSVEGSL